MFVRFRGGSLFRGIAVVLCMVLCYAFFIQPLPALAAGISSQQTRDNILRGLGLFIAIFILNRIRTSASEPAREVSGELRSEIEDDLDIRHHLSEEELDVLAQLIYAEAKGEPLSGQVAVGAVVLNRVESDDFPDTMMEVINQPRQFEPVRRGLMGQNFSAQAYRAALKAASGDDPSRGAVFFYNARTLERTGRQDRLEWFETSTVTTVQIGSHTFSRMR